MWLIIEFYRALKDLGIEERIIGNILTSAEELTLEYTHKMEPLDRAKNIGLTPDFHSPKPSIQTNGREIKEVWCYNLDSEMNAIMKAAEKYPVIGMVCSL